MGDEDKDKLPAGFTDDSDSDDDNDNDNMNEELEEGEEKVVQRSNINSNSNKSSSNKKRKLKQSKRRKKKKKRDKMTGKNDAASDDSDNDDVDSDDDDDDDDMESADKETKKKKSKKTSFIDDAAVDEDDSAGNNSDDDDDDSDDGNEYIKDGFLVDEVEEDNDKKKNDDGLSDSDDDDDDDDDDDSGDDAGGDGDDEQRKRRRRTRKMKDQLTQEDLDLINESKGIYKSKEDDLIEEEEEDADTAAEARKVTKLNELRSELFIDDGNGKSGSSKKKKKKKSNMMNTAKPMSTLDNFDEMDDFIDDDVGDDEMKRRFPGDSLAMGIEEEGVNEAQINEANDIFGTEFLDYMAEQDGDRDEDDDDDMFGGSKKKYRERGVGVQLGVDSDQDDFSDDYDDDDDDLFGDGDDDDDDDGKSAEQRAEALRLKREKRRLAKEERRKKKMEQRKARLRRAFEPVQLIENFCTDRDDDIRATDAPERFYDWKTPFYGKGDVKTITVEEMDEALWIAKRIPDIATEYALAEMEELSSYNAMEEDNDDDESKKRTINIVKSIVHALRFMHKDKLEPEFIRRYRIDDIPSPAVRDNLYCIMDEDAEWDRIIIAKQKVEALLDTMTDIAENGESVALGAAADEEQVAKLKEDLKVAQDRLDDSVRDEEVKKAEIDALEQNDDDEEEDDLFGDDEDDDDPKKMEKKKQKDSLLSHLKTTQSLVKVCAEQVGSIEASLRVVQENIVAQPGQANASNITSQICRDKLWHRLDYQQYVDSLTDYRHIMDLYNYLSLLKEGNDAIQNKDSAMNDADKKKKRSRRFDRDYYRTCVSQGLRRICYKFALGPFRTGIKLEDNIASAAGFNWDKTLPGENSKIGDGESDDPRQWNAPVVKLSDPTSFASDLVSSGELVLLASMNDGNDNSVNQDHPDVSDPLRGCRYVAAMELAYEPRIRRHLRDIYKRHALLTTRPSPKGMDSIDFFHEYYGLHLIHNKKVADHFYPSEKELEMKSMGFSAEERKEMNERTKVVERQCCLQYLNVMKAEKTGHVKVHIHLPFTKDNGDDWYNKEDGFFNCRDNQDLDPFMEELRKVYYPSDGDHDEWNMQREQIIRFALKTFLLPYFEMEVKRELREVAYKMGIRDAGDHLYGMSMEGPYRPSHLLGDNRFLQPTGDLPIVGVCCSSDAKEASFLAAITERGDVIDHLAVPAGVQIDSHNMREKVITFLMQSRPSAIVVGSHAGLSSRLVARKLGALATEATERWNNRFIQGQDEDEAEYQNRLDEFRRLYPNHDDEEEENEIEWKCNVEMVDDNVAQLFGRSVRGKKEFPDSAMNRKCAIAIARHAKDPLAELTYTWSVASDAGVFGTEMLFLNVHPMQRLLPKTLLLREYERVLCRAVAEVGVDVNFSCKYDHARGLLSFVPGFGPRKAASLKHGLERIGGVIATRKDLLSKRLVGPFVYNNAVAFLRVRDIDALSHQNLHPLDDTRLHPHVYHVNNWAIKIAIDALEMENDDADNAGSDERGIMAIKDIMEDSRQEVHRLFKATKDEWERVYGTTFNVGAWDPRVNVPAESWRDKVEELDLDTFAHMIEKDGKGKWLSHLTMIKWEFRLPFEDPRKPMEPLEKEKLFQMLTGESDQTLCPGREVTGKVARISDFGAHLKLEGDVPAFIPNRDLADGHVESAEGFLQIGQIVTAIVTAVKKDHMSVDLSLKEEDLQQAPSSWERPMNLAPLDQFFDKDAAKRIEEGKSKERKERLAKLNALLGSGNNDKSNTAIGRTGRLTNRACTHPVFRNKSHMEVEKELKEEGLVGDALIRPSKTNADALSLHWLVREGFTKIIEIQEEDKDNDASIGNTLKIKNDTYGSIDELLARYVGPMNDRVEELLEHRKFENKSEAEVDKVLQKMKEKSPNGVFYGLCWNEKYPGYASLRFVLNATARYHHIGITPEGFNWCQTNYSEIDYLLNAFKKNPRGKSPNASTNEGASRSSRTSSERISRFARAPSAPRQPPKWTSPSSSHNMVGPSAYNNRPPPPSLPPPSQHAYPPVPPGNPSWNQQRPQPPSLPPPPQHRYPPVPPAPPGYPSQ